MAKQKVTWVHRLVYLFYRGFEGGLRLLPMEFACLVGGALGNLSWLILPRRRRAVLRNLRIAFGDRLTQPELKGLTRQCFQTTGVNMIASLRAVFLNDDELRNRLEIEGQEHVDEFIAQGRGFIGLLAHMGNWELMAQMQRVDDSIPTFGGMYRPLDNPLMDNLIKRRRQKSGARLFSRRDGFFKPTSYLKEGNPLGVFADQHAGKHGVAVPLFGKLTSMTNLPSILCLRADSPVVPVSVSTTALGKWKVKIHPPVKMIEGMEADTKSFVLATAKAYEVSLSESPADVLWMHGYWKIGQRRPLLIDGAKRSPLLPLGSQCEKPFHLLLYAPQAEVSQQGLLRAIGRIQNYRKDLAWTLIREDDPTGEAMHRINPVSTDDPPHLLGHALCNYDAQLTAPMDAAIDLTDTASGATSIASSKVVPVFACTGKYTSSATRAALKKTSPSSETDRYDVLLESLGVQ